MIAAACCNCQSSADHGLEILNSEVVDEPEVDWSQWCACDDVKGGELPAPLVYQARKRELAYLDKMKVYQYFSIAEAIRRSGKRPLRLKWIDVNKGDGQCMNIRSRLVCTEVRPKGVEAIFAATPPH